jgi:26S proteasome regulatory subunit N10
MVLATLTQDFGKVLSSTKNCYIGGSADLITALNVAQLALKHRENKNQRQRIVAFVASPITAGQSASSSSLSSSSSGAAALEEQLVRLGKKMKKNNVAIDIILFGDEGMENEQVMGKFVEACQSGDNW